MSKSKECSAYELKDCLSMDQRTGDSYDADTGGTGVQPVVLDTWLHSSLSPFMTDYHGVYSTTPSIPLYNLSDHGEINSSPSRRLYGKMDNSEYHTPPSRPLYNVTENGEFPWQSYFPTDVTDRLVELVPLDDSPEKNGCTDTSISTSCTAQRLQQVHKEKTHSKKTKSKTKKEQADVQKQTKKETQSKMFIEDKSSVEKTPKCWGCCATSPDQYTKMTHEETPKKSDNTNEQNLTEMSPEIQPKNLAATKNLKYMPVSPELPNLRAYRGQKGDLSMGSPFISPDVVMKIYEHPMKYNNNALRQQQQQQKMTMFMVSQQEGEDALTGHSCGPRSSGEESSYFSSTEWESSTWSQSKHSLHKPPEMKSFKPQSPVSKQSEANNNMQGRQIEESDESGKGPSDLSNEEKTPSSESKPTETSCTQAVTKLPLKVTETVVVKPLTQANVKSMDDLESKKDISLADTPGLVEEKTEVLSSSEMELCYKIYKHYGSRQTEDTESTSGIANTFQSSQDTSVVSVQDSHIPIPMHQMIKDERFQQPGSPVSLQFYHKHDTVDQGSFQISSTSSQSNDSNIDQSEDEFGVLTESDFAATGQDSDGTFGTMSSYGGGTRRTGWLSNERLLEMHPCLKLCQDVDTEDNSNKKDKSLQPFEEVVDNLNKNTAVDRQNHAQINVKEIRITHDHEKVNKEASNKAGLENNDNIVTSKETNANEMQCTSQAGLTTHADVDDKRNDIRKTLNDNQLSGSQEGLLSEYNTLEMPTPMPLLHYSHLELNCALDSLPTSPTRRGLSPLMTSSINGHSALSSPDSMSHNSTVSILSPRKAAKSHRYYSSSIDSSSNISDNSEGLQTVVCAMVHSPDQPIVSEGEEDTNKADIGKKIPPKTAPKPSKKSTVSEHLSAAPKTNIKDTNPLLGNGQLAANVRTRNGSNKVQNSTEGAIKFSQYQSYEHTKKQTATHKDKNCVLFDFDDKIVEELAPLDVKPPRASVRSPKKSREADCKPSSPNKSKQAGTGGNKLSVKSSPGHHTRERENQQIQRQLQQQQQQQQQQQLQQRIMLDLPTTSRHSPKKDSDTTHSGSYGGSYGYTDLSSGSNNLPQRYTNLPPTNIGKCILKFGEKSPHSVQQPGHFSHPKAVDVFPNRDIVVLDSENCTLQIFTEKGVCKKVYQFRSGIIDMIVWDSRTLALLKPGEISMFSLPRYEMDNLRLKNVQFPIALRKMTLPKQDPIFVIAMVTHVVIFTQQGDFLHTIPSNIEKGYGNLYIKRIGRIAVNPKNCDVIIVDIDLKTIYIFSWEGDHKFTIDTKYFPIGPIANPQGIGLDNLGNMIIADSFNHRVVQIFQGGVRVLLQYHMEFFPCAVVVTRDNRLVVAMDSEGRSFAGVRVYNYRHAIR